MSKKQKKSKQKFLKIEDAADYDYHLPVMLREAVDLLITRQDGIYIDGTLGGGGHAAEIIGRLNHGGNLIAFDKDEEAIEYNRVRLTGENQANTGMPKIVLVNDSFDKACSITEGKAISGILLDLGVSSRQLDIAERGFSYRYDSLIDMRFGRKGESAETILNSYSVEQLTDILRRYGEEPKARQIAQSIVSFRRIAPLKSTGELIKIIQESTNPKYLNRTLSRVFQALRIAVNKELEVLEYTLNNIANILEKGGRIVVISYHSLEDRIVKQAFKKQSQIQHRDSVYGHPLAPPVLKIITKNPIVPSDDELIRNPRSRSAKLRAAEKL